MAITILCIFVGIVKGILIGTALFGGVALIVYWLSAKDQKMQMRRRECIKERRKNKVYDNYLTRFESGG